MALSGLSERRELEQTSSHGPSSTWAGERRAGFISQRSTPTPARARRNAASQPASPAPMMVTRCVMESRPVARPPGASHSSRLGYTLGIEGSAT